MRRLSPSSLTKSAIHKLAVDSALFRLKFRATIRLLYNNISVLPELCNEHIELSYRRTEFKSKYQCIYFVFLNRSSVIMVIVALRECEYYNNSSSSR